ncbi:cytochrome P450 [Streptomyces noursei]|uniref:cytochrome P450 n=1 Tax=Streptomyces noursei TaxID=1971 RepID=UPI0036315E47
MGPRPEPRRNGGAPGTVFGQRRCCTWTARTGITVAARSSGRRRQTELLTHYQAVDEAGRIAVLNEILRIDPVIGRLSRRTTGPLDVPRNGDDPLTVPAGERIDILLDHTTLDERTVGPRPQRIRPGRAMREGARSPGLSFGDGPHKCPGMHLALLETDIFLTSLFALPGLRMATPPTIGFIDGIASYELRHCVVEVDTVP